MPLLTTIPGSTISQDSICLLNYSGTIESTPKFQQRLRKFWRRAQLLSRASSLNQSTEMEFGCKHWLRVKSPLPPKLRPNPLLRPVKESPQLKRNLPSLRLLLSSTPSGPTPSNKSDGLNKELPIPRTSLIKLLSTNPGKKAMPDLCNGVSTSSRVD